jgi:hypothetical protein
VTRHRHQRSYSEQRARLLKLWVGVQEGLQPAHDRLRVPRDHQRQRVPVRPEGFARRSAPGKGARPELPPALRDSIERDPLPALGLGLPYGLGVPLEPAEETRFPEVVGAYAGPSGVPR